MSMTYPVRKDLFRLNWFQIIGLDLYAHHTHHHAHRYSAQGAP
jgi:hypothetical protein